MTHIGRLPADGLILIGRRTRPTSGTVALETSPPRVVLVTQSFDDGDLSLLRLGRELFAFGTEVAAEAYAASEGIELAGRRHPGIDGIDLGLLEYGAATIRGSVLMSKIVAYQGAQAGTWTSPMFTPAANSLLVVLDTMTHDGVAPFPSISDSLAGSWGFAVSTPVANGLRSLVWTQQQGASPAARTVTVNPGYQGWHAPMVLQLSGHNVSVPIGTSANLNGASGTTPIVGLSQATSGSLALVTGGANDAPTPTWDGAPGYAPDGHVRDLAVWSKSGGAPAASTMFGWHGWVPTNMFEGRGPVTAKRKGPATGGWLQAIVEINPA